MAKMRAMVVHKAGGPLVAEERDIPAPGDEEMRIRVHACGVCHSNSLTVQGHAGHPISARSRSRSHRCSRRDRRGRSRLERGRARRCRLVWRLMRHLRPLPARQRLRLRECPCGHRLNARRRLRHACDRPCLGSRACAGRSRRNRIGPAALRRHHDLQRSSPQRRRVGRSGGGPWLGGLGHLGVQFAARQGFRTVAVNRGRDKEELARKLGASDYIDSAAEDPAKALTAMGGAKAILATVTDGKAMQAIAGGLGPNGVLMVIGAVGPLTVNSLDLLAKRASVRGWYSGIASDSEDTLQFSLRNKVASMNEIYPFEKAQEAYERMMSGEARFRVVLKM